MGSVLCCYDPPPKNTDDHPALPIAVLTYSTEETQLVPKRSTKAKFSMGIASQLSVQPGKR